MKCLCWCCSIFWYCNFCVNVSAVVGVDAQIASPQHEDVIVSQWRDVSADEQHELREQFDEILRPLGLQTRLVVVEQANSLALYFLCMTLLAVTGLRDLWRRKELKHVVKSLFTLLAGGRVRVIRLRWPAAQYERCLQFFYSLQGAPWCNYTLITVFRV